jgi:glycerol-3-phosphate dehydrogenase
MTHVLWTPGSRELAWEAIDHAGRWDLIVAGGGITGAGVAREAARRGLKVLLVERQDFSWGTSSRSSKMVHGGLRYIAQGDVQTTMHSVRERERLINEAPGLVDLMSYMMPHYRGRFPGPFVFGLLLRVYDFLAGKRYRRFSNMRQTIERFPFLRRNRLLGATEFADAVTDDSRLVMRVLHEARADGAELLNYVGVSGSEQNESGMTVTLTDAITGATQQVQCRSLVNATGVWVNQLRQEYGEQHTIRPARGSHIVIERERLPVDVSFTVLHPRDKRPIFVYPWEGRTVIGTTDLDHPDPGNDEAGITDQELTYLLELVDYQFPDTDLSKRDIISSWSGVRPLVSAGASNSSKESRDHTVWTDGRLISVSGGKLTTFRLIALDVLKAASDWLPGSGSVDDSAPVFTRHSTTMKVDGLNADVIRRLKGFYGADFDRLIEFSKTEDLAIVPGTEMIWAEISWCAAHEAVVHLDDLLLRRTRFGLLVPKGGLTHEERLKALIQPQLRWDEQRWNDEVARYRLTWEQFYWLPSEESERLAGHLLAKQA